MVHTIPAFVALALIIQILIIQICCTTEDDWPLVGASDRSGHCSTGTCAVRSESRAAAHVTGTVYSLPNLIGLSPWHGTVTGADSESYWLSSNAGTTRAGRAVHAATCTVAAARGVAAPTQPGTPRTRVNACAADNALTVMQAAPLQHIRLHSDGSSVRVCIDPSRTLLLVA